MECLRMKRTPFLKNRYAVSAMYDAVLFIVMVSLSGVVLLPALHSDIAIESSVETHQEAVVDEALNTFLVSRVDKFSYKVGGDILDDAAGSIGIDNSSGGLYGSITNWILAREQLHKTHANLLAENLGCQFRLPLSVLGTNRFNIFTGDYDRQLKNETMQFFSSHLGDKYRYNLTAWWHPIKGVPFGGELTIGDTPPNQDCYVAKSFIMMPYNPEITINGVSIVLTSSWLKQQISEDIPSVANITYVLDAYNNGTAPYNTTENATNAIKENATTIMYGFLIDGIQNETNVTIIPGIADIAIDYGFAKIRDAITNFATDIVNDVLGDAFGSIDTMFESMSGVGNPIFAMINETLTDLLSDLIGDAFNSLDEGFDTLEYAIKENVTTMIGNILTPYIDQFVNYVFEQIDVLDIADILAELLFERISINKAEVTLTIWRIRV